MHRQHIEVPLKHHIVIRRGKDGIDQISVHKTTGFEFYARGSTRGYTIDAALMSEVLATIRMPGTWHNTWWGLVRLQSERRTGYIESTQAQITARFGIATGHISEALVYFGDIAWMRRVRNGVYQLNPWLTYRGNSGDQEQSQEEWLEATGGLICHLPERDHPAKWRTERSGTTSPTARRAQLALIPTPDSSRPLVHPAAAQPQPAAAPDLDPRLRQRLRSQRTATARVQLAAKTLGGQPTRAQVQNFLSMYGHHENPDTIKSALRRLKRATPQDTEEVS